MSLKRLFDAGTLASIPWVAEFATRFGRSVILARCLAPNEFGIAVALNVLLTTSLMIGDLGIDKFLMSRPPGKDEETLAATHALHLGKGLLVAALVFAVAPWFARLFGALEATASFRWCAAIVVIHALAHLEIKQAQRDFRYLPNVKAVLASRFAAIGVVYPAVLVFHDNRAMIASLLVSGVVSTCASHLLARTPYRLSFRDRRILWQAVSYVLPLTVNGVALAAKFQFDRAAVGYWLGLTTLAAFAVILNLAAAPISVALGILANLGIPFLTQARAASGARDDAYPALVWVYEVLAAAYASFVAATLDKLVPFIFGPTYQVGPLTQLLISLIAWVRLSRGAPTLLLLVEVDTRRLLTAKSASGSGLVLAVALLPVWPHLETALGAILFGEALSLFYFLRAAKRRTVEQFPAALRELCSSIVPAMMTAAAAGFVPERDLAARLAIFGIAAAIIGAHALFGFRRYFLRSGLLAIFTSPPNRAG